MFILDVDKPFVVMPLCYHPTTVLAVDDEVQFLDILKISVSDHLSLMCFDKPDVALEYVNNSRELQTPFASRLQFTGKSDTKNCGFARMLESTVQDIIHPFPKDIDLTYIKPKEDPIEVRPENSPKTHESLDEFQDSQYILTEKSFYYYNKLSDECEWITSDPVMIKELSTTFKKEIDGLSSQQLDEITHVANHHRPAKLEFLLNNIRNEIYNKNRFKEIILVSTDYDMPGKNGIEFIKSVAFPGITLEHVTIIMTGKISTEFKQKLNSLSLPTEYIGKDDPERINKLLKLVETKTSCIFQDCSLKALTILSQDSNEDACFVFDKAFGDVFNSCLKENNICEIYLFDRQGSYMFLDAQANLSWFIIRSEKGMENSIQLAIEHDAPESVIDALKSKQFVMSLYEESDFWKLKNKEIDWDKYLHPASVFESRINPLEICGIKSNDNHSEETTRKFYYAYIKEFPEFEVDKSRLLSYQEFLRLSE